MDELFSLMLGGDHLVYEQTEKRDCVVSSSSLPQLRYNRQEWETHFLRPLNETPATSEPPTKVRKLNVEATARRCLKMEKTLSQPQASHGTKNQVCNPKANCPAVSSSPSCLVSFSTPAMPSHIRMPRVPLRGGECILEGGVQTTLTNTCPVDNFLAMFFLLWKENQALHSSLTQRTEPCIEALLEATRQFQNGEFARGKVAWLRQLPQFNFGTCGSINVWGNEHDLFRKKS